MAPRPERVTWADLRRLFYQEHRQGQHTSILGRSGSGKSTLLRELAKIRASRKADDGNPSRVTYLATKRRDTTIEELGWPILKKWPPGYGQWHVIVWPRYDSPDGIAARQRRVFRPLLSTLFLEGGQTVCIDELKRFTQALPEGMGLFNLIDEIESEARSSDLSLFGTTQRPRWVPVSFWTEATWVAVFRVEDRADRRRICEFLGGRMDDYDDLIANLPDHEFIFLRRQGASSEYYISKVEL